MQVENSKALVCDQGHYDLLNNMTSGNMQFEAVWCTTEEDAKFELIVARRFGWLLHRRIKKAWSWRRFRYMYKFEIKKPLKTR